MSSAVSVAPCVKRTGGGLMGRAAPARGWGGGTSAGVGPEGGRGGFWRVGCGRPRAGNRPPDAAGIRRAAQNLRVVARRITDDDPIIRPLAAHAYRAVRREPARDLHRPRRRGHVDCPTDRHRRGRTEHVLATRPEVVLPAHGVTRASGGAQFPTRHVTLARRHAPLVHGQVGEYGAAGLEIARGTKACSPGGPKIETVID